MNKFKEFAQDKFFDRNEIKEFQSKKNGDTYICYLKFGNKENIEEEKAVILIMKLLDGTNFEISFSGE